MTVYDLKPAFQNLLRPIVKTLHKIGVTPNQVTIATCLLSLVYSYGLYTNIESKAFLSTVPLFFFIRMALNAIDGMLAKEHNLTSNFGALLNELTDVVSDSAFYLVFCAHPNISPTLVVLFTIVAIYVEFVGVSAKLINSERRFDGPFGKSDRAVFCSVIALLLAHTSLSASVYTYTFSVAILLMVLTIVNRMKKALN